MSARNLYFEIIIFTRYLFHHQIQKCFGCFFTIGSLSYHQTLNVRFWKSTLFTKYTNCRLHSVSSGWMENLSSNMHNIPTLSGRFYSEKNKQIHLWPSSSHNSYHLFVTRGVIFISSGKVTYQEIQLLHIENRAHIKIIVPLEHPHDTLYIAASYRKENERIVVRICQIWNENL